MSQDRPIGPEDSEELIQRFERHLSRSALLRPGSAVTVAISGGIDSVVMLDLLVRLRPAWDWRLSAAHFDHTMRPGSEEDAAWVGSLCQRLGMPCLVGRPAVRPGNETEARRLRYDFLLRARSELRGELLATAHQADDQAETVLFRLLRGSGLAGLAGIPERRSPNIIRPLLPFWREEIEAHAGAAGLQFRTDPTNADVTITRNRLRNQVIPAIESNGRPEFRRQLRRIAELASRASLAVDRRLEPVLGELILEASESRVIVARTGLLAYDTRVRSHLLRALAARVGPRPGRVGTCVALEFTNTGSSGRAIDLPGGVVLRREFERLIIERRRQTEDAGDIELVLRRASSGASSARIAGIDWRVRWKLGRLEEGGEDDLESASFNLSELQFPLTVRGWRPGDRIRSGAGTRKLKRVFGDRKVGLSERKSYPLVADADGVLWVVGLMQGTRAAAVEDEALSVWFERDR